MAIVVGALSGAGLVTACELGRMGFPYVATVSRSGHTDQRKGIEELIEQLRQSTSHIDVKCDTSDGAAYADMIASFSKPIEGVDYEDDGGDEVNLSEFLPQLMHNLTYTSPGEVDKESSEQTLDMVNSAINELMRQTAQIDLMQRESYSAELHKSKIFLEDLVEQAEQVAALIKTKFLGRSSIEA
eukprot:gnl/TRDRNA2_/TRDRNA2_185378_c0_seq1.p1 gnl/TRDRNA2_/TRDRNA2_185378_c0~~gnl/TRDRNA2_/TRDRNA2_185378_c0_seq1.p1  ORF type:complete len:185 (+),score=44.54 gnl/TRDRNA2_/TRDRNA2_185378_c0_seq1:118-672(+)